MLIPEPARPFFNRARNAECLLLALSDESYFHGNFAPQQFSDEHVS
jgi:hypothetical protein